METLYDRWKTDDTFVSLRCPVCLEPVKRSGLCADCEADQNQMED
jgi:hypothetical protein